MRLLFLNPVAGLGGAERVLLDWLASLRAVAPSAALGLVTFADGPLVGEARALGVEARVVPLPQGLLRLGDSGQRGRNRLVAGASLGLRGLRASAEGLRFLRALRAEVASFRPSLLHSNGVKSHLVSTLVKPARVPLVWHIHDFLGERPLVSGLLKPCALRADLAIANSGSVAEDTRALFSRLPVRVVYNAVDAERFAPEGTSAPLDALAGLLAVLEKCLRVGLVATYARWKGQDVFLQAAARARAARPDVPLRFYVVGGPIYEMLAFQFSGQELRDMVVQSGLDGHVGLVPFHERPEEIFRALDVVVHASTRPEPFGRTIVEGMASAKPVPRAARAAPPSCSPRDRMRWAWSPGTRRRSHGPSSRSWTRPSAARPWVRPRGGRRCGASPASGSAPRRFPCTRRFCAARLCAMRDASSTRLCLLADPPGEGWPSMDLVAEMLERGLTHSVDGPRFGEVTRVAPPLPRVVRRLPKMGARNAAFNVDRMLTRFGLYPLEALRLRSRADLFHVADHTYAQLVHALPSEYTGVYCHDIDAFRSLVEPGKDARPAWFRAMARVQLAGMQRAAVGSTARARCGRNCCATGSSTRGSWCTRLTALRPSLLPRAMRPCRRPSRRSAGGPTCCTWEAARRASGWTCSSHSLPSCDGASRSCGWCSRAER